MADRRLSAEEAALWARVMASARPLAAQPMPALPTTVAPPRVAAASAHAPPALAPKRRDIARVEASVRTLDAGWDRRLSRGLVSPESAVDLHGHTLASAHAMLDAGLDRAIRRGDRVLLLVTGKPPRPEAERPYARGVIRAAVGDWLAASRHADRIAAVRNAHPRHGGQGALYIVLRRARETAAARLS